MKHTNEQLSKAISLHRNGKSAEAEQLYSSFLSIDPRNADVFHLRGLLRIESGRMSEAISDLRIAHSLVPASPVFMTSLARACRKAGDISDVLRELTSFVQMYPGHHECWFELGELYRNVDDLAKAAEAYRKTIAIKDDFFPARINLATALKLTGDFTESSTHFVYAAKVKPDDPRIQYMAAATLSSSGKELDAIPYYQRAMKLDPDNYEILCGFGTVLLKGYDLSGALACFKKALILKSDLVEVHAGIASCLQKMGETKEACREFRIALDSAPSPDIHSDYLFCMNHEPECSPEELFKEHVRFSGLYCSKLPVITNYYTDTEGKRIKVGYVSPDFRAHPVGYFFEPILRNHNREKCEIFCYYTIKDKDSRTAVLQELSQHWRDCHDVTDEKLADIIVQDKIGILVDLAGHTSGSRLLLFGRKPAPVQVTYLGYPNTTGIDRIDYRFTDAIADPASRDAYHVERLIRLPNCFLAYSPPSSAPPVGPLPFAKNDYVTFGSFNRLTKINRSVVMTWAAILRNVNNSRFLFKTGSFNDPSTVRHFKDLFGSFGIDESRILFHQGTSTFEEHLNLYNSIDIALDTFPYNGTTTTFEALLMGVPVVCLEGTMHAGRVGASILHNIGMTGLLGKSKEDYVNIAADLAGDSARLGNIRGNLRKMLLESRLCDGAHLTRNIEQAYCMMWKEYLNKCR